MKRWLAGLIGLGCAGGLGLQLQAADSAADVAVGTTGRHARVEDRHLGAMAVLAATPGLNPALRAFGAGDLPAPAAEHVQRLEQLKRELQGVLRERQAAGAPQGAVKRRLADGSAYTGEWRAGRRQGLGTLRHPAGWCYEGEWMDDAMQGRGRLEHRDGWAYTGEWRAGKRHGLGVMAYTNGWRYEGRWANDRMDGRGKLTQADGRVVTGEWRAGKRVASGTR